VENGPSGFDPAAPAWVTKQKFTVLAAIPKVAQARTRYDDASGVMTAEAPGRPTFAGRLVRPPAAKRSPPGSGGCSTPTTSAGR
jgi:hypothetical protein